MLTKYKYAILKMICAEHILFQTVLQMVVLCPCVSCQVKATQYAPQTQKNSSDNFVQINRYLLLLTNTKSVTILLLYF